LCEANGPKGNDASQSPDSSFFSSVLLSVFFSSVFASDFVSVLELLLSELELEDEEDPEEDKGWLINDIIAYANNDKATMYGYVDNFYNIFKRNISLQTNDNIDKYIIHLYKKSAKTKINIFLGLLTIDERNDVIQQFYRKLN
jgi:hypothetical protein